MLQVISIAACELPGSCGAPTFRWNGHVCPNVAYSDGGLFSQIVRNHQLVALNTWNGQDGPTFVHQHFQRRIDFILCRKSSVDRCALDVKQLWNFSLLPLTGFHVPLAGHISRCWQQADTGTAHHRFSMKQRLQCRQWQHARNETWNSFRTDLSKDLLQSASRDVLDDVVANIHDTLGRRFQDFWMNSEGHSHTVHASATVDTVAHSLTYQKWFHWRICKQQTQPTLRQFFDGWFHAAKFLSLKRTLQGQMRKWKKQKFADVLQEAQVAATHHDLGKLHRLINKISPKQQKVKIQLRMANGTLAGPVEAHGLYCAFVQDKWNLEPLTQPSPLRESWHVAPGTPFTIEQLEQGLRQIPALKAVAFPYAPAQLIKCQAQTIAALLYPAIQQWWSTYPPYIPQEWKDGWMVWRAKPGKRFVEVANLRILALAEPYGKIIIGLIAKAAISEISDRLCRLPQFAYMANRGTTDALRRAALHCESVSALLESQQSTVKNKRDQQPRLTCYGGIQVCLDLTRAFDQAHRGKMILALRRLGVSDELCALLQLWHRGTRYIINSGASETACPTYVGVRQGCTAAPTLWSALVGDMLEALIQLTSWQWVTQSMTVYADDFHAADTIHSPAQFLRFLDNLGILHDLMQEYDLMLNATKSVVLLRLQGVDAPSLFHSTLRCKMDANIYVFPGQMAP